MMIYHFNDYIGKFDLKDNVDTDKDFNAKWHKGFKFIFKNNEWKVLTYFYNSEHILTEDEVNYLNEVIMIDNWNDLIIKYIKGKMTHELKTHKQYFEEVFMCRKTFEVRINDRNFKKGDTLILKEWDSEKQEYTGRKLARNVTYTLNGGQFGIEDGYIVMAIN